MLTPGTRHRRQVGAEDYPRRTIVCSAMNYRGRRVVTLMLCGQLQGQLELHPGAEQTSDQAAAQT
jgi:hypothetical protein